MTLFTDFGLASPILKALATEGYEKPTPIQAQAIPYVMAGRDICGIAQTGTGKTAAFALPILHRLTENPRAAVRKGCRVLVLSPTRELASQIADSFRTYGRHMKLTTSVVFGGVAIGKQERDLSFGVDVLVATPGRLLDLIDRRALSLRDVEILVLDEADQMLDLGFIHALKRIVTHAAEGSPDPVLLGHHAEDDLDAWPTPSCAIPPASPWLRSRRPPSVSSRASCSCRPAASRLSSRPCCRIRRSNAFSSSAAPSMAPTRSCAVSRRRASTRRPFTATSRSRSVSARSRRFRAGSCRVLVATDIAARGIDVDGVSHVINYDLPNVPESYVHRIGRTARAGATGIAMSFCNDEERAFLRDIEKLTRLKVPVAPLPEGFQAGPVAGERDEPREPRRQQQAQRPRSAPHARGNQGHGAPRVSDPNADRGPKRHRPRGAKPAGATSGNGQRQQQPARASASEGRGDGRQVSWLDKGPRGR